jgi:hypothetical protein
MIAPQQDRALERRTHEAWQRYAEDLRDLDGARYVEAEDAAWDRLQTVLADIAAEHAALLDR